MSKEQMIDLVNNGREIEFRYGGKMYSITYGMLEGKHVISFCEFNKDTTEVDNAEELSGVMRNGLSVVEMLEKLTDDDIRIY